MLLQGGRVIALARSFNIHLEYLPSITVAFAAAFLPSKVL